MPKKNYYDYIPRRLYFRRFLESGGARAPLQNSGWYNRGYILSLYPTRRVNIFLSLRSPRTQDNIEGVWTD